MHPKFRQLFIVITTIGISCIFILIAIHIIPFDDVSSRISQADLGGLLVAVGVTSVAIYCRTVRWKVLLQAEVKQFDLFRYVSIGTLLNQLPMRVGDLTRATLVQSNKTPLVSALATLLIENLLDIAIVVIVLVLSFGFLPTVPPEIINISYLFGLFAFSGVGVIILLIYYPRIGHRLTNWLIGQNHLFVMLKIDKRYKELLIGGESLRSITTLLQVILWTIVLWLANIGAFWVTVQALHLNLENTVQWSALGVMLISLSLAIPISFAGIGPYQTAVVIAGQMVGIGLSDSFTVGVVVHALSVLTFLGWGLLSLTILRR